MGGIGNGATAGEVGQEMAYSDDDHEYAEASALALHDTDLIGDARDLSLPRVALFDFDGVLVHGDLFASFLRQRLRRQFWRLLLALPVSPLLLLGMLLPPTRTWVTAFFIRLGLIGSSVDALRRQLERLARDQGRRPGAVMRDGVLALRRHLASGDRVLIVTGCEETMVRALMAEIALDEVDVVGSRLASGWLGARLVWHNVGRRKLEALARAGVVAPWAIAYSDSSRDTPMLKAAAQPVLVNAGTRLCRLMERRLGRPLQRVEWR